MEKDWWKHSVVYQVYPQSFNNDFCRFFLALPNIVLIFAYIYTKIEFVV